MLKIKYFRKLCCVLIFLIRNLTRIFVFPVNLQQPLSDIPSDSSSVASNKENAPPSSGNTGSGKESIFLY